MDEFLSVSTRMEDGRIVPVPAAIELYENAITESDDGNAMYLLANLLRSDIAGDQRDMERAVELFRGAMDNDGTTEENRISSMYNLAICLETGKGIREDKAHAIQYYERAIDEGNHIKAMLRFACLLKGSHGVNLDQPRAVKLFERAVNEGGHVMSMLNLVSLYYLGGLGVKKNFPRAVELCRRFMAEDDDPLAIYILANIMEYHYNDIAVSEDLYELAKERNFNPLGYSWWRDQQQIDDAYAAARHERAIREKKDIDAMCNLATLLTTGGKGVAVDAERAVALYERAIDEGKSIDAIMRLADLLRYGAKGVEPNGTYAFALFERALNVENHIDAAKHLANLLQIGAANVPIDMPRAVKLYERSIKEANDPDSMACLADIMRTGAEGVECNGPLAVD